MLLKVGGGVEFLFPETLKFFRKFVALRLHSLGFGDGGTAIEVDHVEVPEDQGRVHAALAQLFFDEGQIIADKCKIQHRTTD